jgi:hypothetical protein
MKRIQEKKVHRESEGDSGFRPSSDAGVPLMKSIRGCAISTSPEGVENTPACDYSVNTVRTFDEERDAEAIKMRMVVIWEAHETMELGVSERSNSTTFLA